MPATPFDWKENLACVATYKVLEGDRFLDQFEDVDIPFEHAAEVALGTLRYFPHTTKDAQIIRMLALEIARDFLKILIKTFTVEKQNAAVSTQKTIKGFAKVFENPKKTIRDLAKAVDDHVKFPDEQ